MPPIQSIWTYGILIAFIAILIPSLHYMRCLYYVNKDKAIKNTNFIPYITIILPLKNEEIVIRHKLEEIMTMDYPLDKIRLLILDSQSKDGTVRAAKDFLISQNNDIKYDISILDKPGKSYAVNRALDLIKTDFFVMLDAEAILSKTSIRDIIDWFSMEDIGGVCGKFAPQKNDLDINYRNNFNILRIGESIIHSTPIFEGSICAFRLSALNGKKIDQNINSDDTQLSLLSIRNGYRSIMDKNILFTEPPTGKKNRRKRQLRRAQGLVRTLIINWDLSLLSKIKGIYLHTFYFHIIMPWLFLISFSSMVASTYLSFNAYGIINLDRYKISSLIFLLLCLTSPFRNFIFGISVLIEAQILWIFGKKLNIWETNNNLRKKSTELRKN
jgi:cellulose synthase/poly-beta-1,6-N-acetylglucosamine synthase-like glycosyltransferase